MTGSRGRSRIASFGYAVFLASGLVSLAGCGRGRSLEFPAAPVVLISVDTLRADHLPAYGYRAVSTPHIDALAKDSVLFENAYSHVPLTLASHASLMSGLLPAENGVRDNYGYALPPKLETLASFLKAHGYATGGAISAAVLAKGSGIEHGFDFYDDDVSGAGREERDGSRTAAALEGWLASHHGGAFFAFLHLFEPHTPYEPPEPFKSRYPLAYDGEIARADEIVGGWIAKLKEWDVYDRSLIVFLSDHGEGLGDHGEREHGVFLYREAIHVPLLVKFPRQRRAGERVAPPVALTDVFPTVAEVAGLPARSGLSGVTLTAAVEGRADAGRAIASETFYPRLRLGWSDLASLVDARHHYIEAPRAELYDVVADPGEKNDLAPGLPPAFRSMRLELARRSRPFERPTDQEDPERARRLASLGYLTATSPDAGRSKLPDPKDEIALLDARHDFALLLAGKDDVRLVAACREFVARVPGALDVWRMLADALDRRGQHAESITALEAGLRGSAATGSPAIRDLALARLATFLVRAGRRDEALRIAQAVPLRDAESLNAIGVAWSEAGKPEEARRCFEKAVAADPTDALANLNLGTAILREGDAPAARLRLEEAVRLDPRSAEAWEALGQARAGASDLAGARLAWERAIALDPSRYQALFNLGIAAGRSGDMAAAGAALRKFVARAPAGGFRAELAEARRLLATMP